MADAHNNGGTELLHDTEVRGELLLPPARNTMDPWYIRKSIAPLLLAKHSSRTSSSAVNGGSISSGAADSTTLARSTAARRIHLTTPSCFDNNDDSGRLAVLSSFDDNDRYLVAPRHGQAKRPVRRRHEKHLDARLGDASEVRGMREFDLRRRPNRPNPLVSSNHFHPIKASPNLKPIHFTHFNPTH
uniref:Uncharacterized protein n=1 Tax=Oryza nivara TaxID=4536 RepID=A0A0E0H5B0_ORYNI